MLTIKTYIDNQSADRPPSSWFDVMHASCLRWKTTLQWTYGIDGEQTNDETCTSFWSAASDLVVTHANDHAAKT